MSPLMATAWTGNVEGGSDMTGLEKAAMAALLRVRGGVINLVDEQKMRLRGDRHAAFIPVANISLRLE